MHDVRDLRGRLARVGVAIVFGIIGSLAITYALPTRDHFERMGGCMRGEGWFVRGGSPTLILVGAVMLALGSYSLLGRLAKRPRSQPARLPHAIMVMGRRPAG